MPEEPPVVKVSSLPVAAGASAGASVAVWAGASSFFPPQAVRTLANIKVAMSKDRNFFISQILFPFKVRVLQYLLHIIPQPPSFFKSFFRFLCIFLQVSICHLANY